MLRSRTIERLLMNRNVVRFVIDEAQDMGTDDFRLVKALMEQNEDMRVIAVGDDDQNIYAFRGSNSAHLRAFIEDYGAKTYELTENYRSDQAIIDYANRFALGIPNRMKQNPIKAVCDEPGHVESSANFSHFTFNPSKKKGTTAVLTVTNEQTLQVAHMLRQQGKHVKLIQTTEGFRFINLAEVRYFFKQLGKSEDGRISYDQWENAKKNTEAKYATSNCLEAMRQFFNDFETTHKTFYRSDLREFVLESNYEDFIASEDNTVFVSTIHKAKGREFDTVHLMVGNIQMFDEDMLRTIYVGITRAKHNLFIYKDSAFLDTQPSIVISLSMHDVWLDYFRNHKEQTLRLRSGDKMNYSLGCLSSVNGTRITYLSNSMRDRLKELETKGFEVTDTEVSFIIAWRPPEEQEEIAVCLANITLTKTKMYSSFLESSMEPPM